jgi:hypothetical protein
MGSACNVCHMHTGQVQDVAQMQLDTGRVNGWIRADLHRVLLGHEVLCLPLMLLQSPQWQP